jgi:hypothetical protein
LKKGVLVSKVVIPVKTGIQIGTITHNFWIPACAGMTKTLKNGTYDTKLLKSGMGSFYEEGLCPS